MGRKILSLAPSLLARIFKDGTGMVEVRANPLPADARIVAAWMDAPKDVIFLVVESAGYLASEGMLYDEVEQPVFMQEEPEPDGITAAPDAAARTAAPRPRTHTPGTPPP